MPASRWKSVREKERESAIGVGVSGAGMHEQTSVKGARDAAVEAREAGEQERKRSCIKY